MSTPNCLCPSMHNPGEVYSDDLSLILGAHGVAWEATSSWLDAYAELCRVPSLQSLVELLQRVPCPPATPPKVARFLLIDTIQHYVWAELRRRPETADGTSGSPTELGDAQGATDEAVVFSAPPGLLEGGHGTQEVDVRDPDRSAVCEPERLDRDFNRRVLATLVEVGEHVLADELRDRPVQFWLTHFEGWAEATSKVSAHLALAMEPWMTELSIAARECVSFRRHGGFPAVGPKLSVEAADKQVEMPPGYRLEIPEMVLDLELSSEPKKIWLRPNIPHIFHSLPIEVEFEWPKMTVDVSRLQSLFSSVSQIEWTEDGCPVCGPGVTVLGYYRGHAVELAVKREPRPPLEYSLDFN